jgi:hypothetical protein
MDAAYSGFLKSALNALRASEELRGPWPLLAAGEGGWAEGDASRATVTRGSNNVQSLALSFTAIRTGMGFRHWKRVEGSKWAHCLQQCSAAPHFGQLPLKAVPLGSCVEQL